MSAVCEIKVKGSDRPMLIDSEDYAVVAKYNWRLLNGYPATRVRWVRDGVRGRDVFKVHKLIFTPRINEVTDHINRDKLDNRKCNLRSVTLQQNMWNKRTSRKNPSSEYKGVSFCKNANKWRSSIQMNGKFVTIGHFINEVDAAQAYNFIAADYHGEYAYLNTNQKVDI